MAGQREGLAEPVEPVEVEAAGSGAGRSRGPDLAPVAGGEGAAIGGARLWALVLPLPVILGTMAILWVWRPEAVFASPSLLLLLNHVFTTLASVLVVYLAARSYLVRGELSFLLLAGGALAWGLGGLLTTAAGWRDANVAVTIHNLCALLSAAFHAGGVLVLLRGQVLVRHVDRAFALTLGGGLTAVALVTWAALSGLTPTFFVQGAGGTPPRQAVTALAAGLFAASAALLGLRRGSLSRSGQLYALALALIGAGLLGVRLQPELGSALNWVARASQFLGGAYLLGAGLASMRESGGWRLSLEAGLADAQSRLAAQHARYRAFFENLSELVAVCQPIRGEGGAIVDWEVLDANEACAGGFGVPRERLVGRRVSQLHGPARLAEWSREWAKVLQTGRPEGAEWSLAGRRFLVTVFRADGATIALSGVDITERGRAEQAVRESERLYRAIGESIEYGVWVCAPDGRNIYASESFLRLVGITQAQCSDFGWGDVLHPEDAPGTIAAWKECVRTGGTWDREHRFRGVDGRWHPVLARGKPVRDDAGEIVCWAGINLDISLLKEAEERLRESDRNKSEFLAVLSHELRNPLAPIRNSAHLLALAEPGSPQAARAREVIERQVDHLTRLVDDLLDLTRIARGKVRLARQRVDLRDVVVETCEDHRALLAGRGIALQVEAKAGAMAEADPTRVSQVVANLLQNGAKFTPEGGTVRVSLVAAGGLAELRVRDDGVGIEPGLLDRVFEPFTQAERSLARSQGGLGLGLALVKGLVELHGGTVAARSAGPGLGAEFVVSLPLAAGSAEPVPEAPRPVTARPLDVLIVEDNADAAEMLRDVLELTGNRARVAPDGRTGIALAREWRPDVVLCDIGLPDLDGFEVARAIRSDPALQRTRLVALSGYAQEEDRARARSAGFDVVLAKPAPIEELEAVLAQAATR